MIQKLEQRVIGTDHGCSGASFSEVIDKVNEVIDYINSRPEETNEAASTMAPSCWSEEQGEVELVNDLVEDALLLERAWLTLDGFGHEELAGRLRQFAERKGLIWK